MLQAGREGLTRGDYAFFYIDIFGASLQGSRFPEPQRPWKRGDQHDASAQQAFEVSTGLRTAPTEDAWARAPTHVSMSTGTHPRGHGHEHPPTCRWSWHPPMCAHCWAPTHVLMSMGTNPRGHVLGHPQMSMGTHPRVCMHGHPLMWAWA